MHSCHIIEDEEKQWNHLNTIDYVSDQKQNLIMKPVPQKTSWRKAQQAKQKEDNFNHCIEIFESM